MTKLIKTVPGIRVRTAQVGFRRGGRGWSGVMEVAVSEFTPVQLKQIRAEPLLVVEDIEINLEQATDADNEVADDSVGADLSAQDEVLNALDFADGLQQAPNSSAALLDLPGEVIVNAETDKFKKGEIIESTIGERSDNADSGVQIQPGSGDFTPVPEAKPAKKPAK
ncbi:MULTISPECIES: hypothetical protein [Methylobacter]